MSKSDPKPAVSPCLSGKELLERAMENPGIREAMEVYEPSRQIEETLHALYLASMRPVVYGASTSSSE